MDNRDYIVNQVGEELANQYFEIIDKQNEIAKGIEDEVFTNECFNKLFAKLNEKLGEFKYTVDFDRESKKIKINSENISLKDKLINMVWKELHIENFGHGIQKNSVMYTNTEQVKKFLDNKHNFEMSYWIELDYRYESYNFGKNGTALCNAYYYPNEKNWEIVWCKDEYEIGNK